MVLPSGAALSDPISGWQRPFREAPAGPPDLALVAGPVSLSERLLSGPAVPAPSPPAALAWLDAGLTGPTARCDLWGVPTHRLAGMYAPANAEFNTPPFKWPGGAGVYINAATKWPGVEPGQDVGGSGLRCDERCQAYVMVEVLAQQTAGGNWSVVPGFEAARCIVRGIDTRGQVPLEWIDNTTALGGGAVTRRTTADLPPSVQQIKLRLTFRDAVLYALTWVL